MDLIKREVVASQGVIVSNNPLASLAGAEMYAIGGNAFDAAVASLFALTVVEPFMVSVFGAGFFVIRSDEKQCVETLDNYAMAPLKASSTMFEMVERRKPGQDIFETVGRKNLHGPLSVATPGTLKAWEYINQKYGSLPLEKVIAPAIRYAYMGYTSSPLMQWISDYYREDLIKYPETSKIFLPGGKPVPPGTLIKMPNYGETLEKIASEGSNSLYNGDIGKQVVEYLGESEGILSMEDLNRYKLVEREPVMCTYRDIYEIYSMAPGSSGGTHIIQMLNILENYDIAGMGFPSAKYLHVLAEVMKIAFSDRQKYMGDPMLVNVPLKWFLSKEYARTRYSQIEETAKRYSYGDPGLVNEGKNTTHVSAMDDEGNMVATTQTLNGGFGSMITVPSNGILLNNCMALFDPRPGKANSIAGGKRMLSSMSPTIILRNSEPYFCLGTPGGLQIFPSVAQAIVNVIDHKMSIQEAVEAPRIWTMGINNTPGEKLLVEKDLSKKICDSLISMGHDLLKLPIVAGGMNGVLRDPQTGMLHGGACWRADGTPMGVSGGRAHPKAFEPDPLF